MNVLDLFSGIGGFSLGLHRVGFKTVAFCEIEEYPQKVLKKNFPGVPVFSDIRSLTKEKLNNSGVSKIDIATGGFPCQDVSIANTKAKGLEGERSGLWKEQHRIISEIRPSYAIMENSPALVVRGLDRVLGDLAEIGYDAEWRIISAAEFGAPHTRKRCWIVAYPNEDGREENQRIFNKEFNKKKSCRWQFSGTSCKAPGKKALPEWFGVDDGITTKLDQVRIECCGNAIVPDIAEAIGMRIKEIGGC